MNSRSLIIIKLALPMCERERERENDGKVRFPIYIKPQRLSYLLIL